jgi:hypothetical protein
VTEADWLAAADPAGMMRCDLVLASPRKVRLCGCAAVRAFADQITDPRLWKALDAAERYADGRLSRTGLKHWSDQVNRLCLVASRDEPVRTLASRVRDAVANCCHNHPAYYQKVVHWLSHLGGCVNAETLRAVRAAQVGIVRDIFGNPFRPVPIDPRWRTADVLGLAGGIYEERAFDRMPLLADALMDAGCDSDDILAHCRSGGPHVRGCWVVDLVLGKE